MLPLVRTVRAGVRVSEACHVVLLKNAWHGFFLVVYTFVASDGEGSYYTRKGYAPGGEFPEPIFAKHKRGTHNDFVFFSVAASLRACALPVVEKNRLECCRGRGRGVVSLCVMR